MKNSKMIDQKQILTIVTYVKLWKFVSAKDIENIYAGTLKKDKLYRILRLLVKKEILISYDDPFDFRCLYFCLGPASSLILGEILNLEFTEKIDHHELNLTKFMRGISFFSNYIKHEFVSNNDLNIGIVPDGKVVLKINEKEVFLAIEVENNQKEKSRVITKFKNYIQSNGYDGVIYTFTNHSTLNAYLNYLEMAIPDELNEKEKEAIWKRFLFVYLIPSFLPVDVSSLICSRNKKPYLLEDVLNPSQIQNKKMHSKFLKSTATEYATN